VIGVRRRSAGQIRLGIDDFQPWVNHRLARWRPALLWRKSSVVTRFGASAGAVRRRAFPDRCRSLWPDRGPRWAELTAVPVLQSALHRAGGGPQRPSDFCTGSPRSAANAVLGRVANSSRAVNQLNGSKPPVKFAGLKRPDISVHKFRQLACFARREVAIRHRSGNDRHRRGRIGG
jgi:hypothetical protein